MIRLTAALLSGLLLLTPVLASTDKDKQAPKDKGDKKEESLSFSNSDLERRYGGGAEKKKSKSEPPAPAAEKKSGASGGAALEKLFADEAARKQSAGKVAEAEAAVASAKERIAQLEKRKLAIVNPFLARPAAPEDEAKAESWKEQGAAGRVSSTDAELEAARKALADAQAALATARRN